MMNEVRAASSISTMPSYVRTLLESGEFDRMRVYFQATDAELAYIRTPMPAYLRAPVPEYLRTLHDGGEPTYIRALRESGQLDRDLAFIRAADHLRPADHDFEIARTLQAGIPEGAP